MSTLKTDREDQDASILPDTNMEIAIPGGWRDLSASTAWMRICDASFAWSCLQSERGPARPHTKKLSVKNSAYLTHTKTQFPRWYLAGAMVVADDRPENESWTWILEGCPRR